MNPKAMSLAMTVQDPRHPDLGKSISFTVKDQDPDRVVRDLNDFARGRWTATDINDKRHKRR